MSRQVEANRRYEARQAERDLVELRVWIPRGDREEILRECRQRREAHLALKKKP